MQSTQTTANMTATESRKAQQAQETKATAAQNIIAAAHEFFCVSPRFTELKDKAKSGAWMSNDESMELAWLEVLSVNLNLYLGE